MDVVKICVTCWGMTKVRDSGSILKRVGNTFLVKWDNSSKPVWESVNFMRGTAPYSTYKKQRKIKTTQIHKQVSPSDVKVEEIKTASQEKVDSKTAKSRYPSTSREKTKNEMNDVFAELCDANESRNALVLDDPATFRSSLRISKTCVTSIIVPNDEISSSEPRIMRSCTVNIFAKKLCALLYENPDLFVDAMLLDFCGQFKTCRNDIKVAIRRLNTDGFCAPFAITLCYTRGGDSPETILSETSDMFAEAGLVSDLKHTIIENGMVTYIWTLTRNP